MKIGYDHAHILEGIVRYVHSCGAGGFGGKISVHHFSNYPLDAALIALAPIWKRIDCKKLEDFFSFWEDKLRHKTISDNELWSYIKALQSLVHEAMDDIPKIDESVQDYISS